MTHVSLFTGIGGLDLAAEWAGFETVLQVEREPYALRVLEKHWPDVPRMTDVREVTSESVKQILADADRERYRQDGIQRGEQTEERTSNRFVNSSDVGTGADSKGGYADRPVTVVSGGFPCQPFSAAGKRRGTDDDRYLWPELLRIVEELRPAWVVGENVSGLLSIDGGLEIDRMLASLEARDYNPWVLHYPAAGVGAPHKRDRVFIVGHAVCEHGVMREAKQQEGQGLNFGSIHSERLAPWWTTEPDVGRVASGVPRRVDRLRALGNAVVPQQAYPIFAAIATACQPSQTAPCLRSGSLP